MDLSAKKRLDDKGVGELWRQYRPQQGQDPGSDLVLSLLCKLVTDQALTLLYGNWDTKIGNALSKYGISPSEGDG
jgi:hypothetical protein